MQGVKLNLFLGILFLVIDEHLLVEVFVIRGGSHDGKVLALQGLDGCEAKAVTAVDKGLCQGLESERN